jgi:hypothetical protein
MELTLKRFLITDDGVLGVLINGTRPIALTLEEEWKDNARGISCIPAASYLCQKVTTPRHGETYQVLDVPGRTAILIHSGNTEEDTEGCILLGKEFGDITVKDEDTGRQVKKLAVLRSKEAFAEFMKAVDNKQSFALHIRIC